MIKQIVILFIWVSSNVYATITDATHLLNSLPLQRSFTRDHLVKAIKYAKHDKPYQKHISKLLTSLSSKRLTDLIKILDNIRDHQIRVFINGLEELTVREFLEISQYLNEKILCSPNEQRCLNRIYTYLQKLETTHVFRFIDRLHVQIANELNIVAGYRPISRATVNPTKPMGINAKSMPQIGPIAATGMIPFDQLSLGKFGIRVQNAMPNHNLKTMKDLETLQKWLQSQPKRLHHQKILKKIRKIITYTQENQLLLQHTPYGKALGIVGNSLIILKPTLKRQQPYLLYLNKPTLDALDIETEKFQQLDQSNLERYNKSKQQYWETSIAIVQKAFPQLTKDNIPAFIGIKGQTLAPDVDGHGIAYQISRPKNAQALTKWKANRLKPFELYSKPFFVNLQGAILNINPPLRIKDTISNDGSFLWQKTLGFEALSQVVFKEHYPIVHGINGYTGSGMISDADAYVINRYNEMNTTLQTHRIFKHPAALRHHASEHVAMVNPSDIPPTVDHTKPQKEFLTYFMPFPEQGVLKFKFYDQKRFTAFYKELNKHPAWEFYLSPMLATFKGQTLKGKVPKELKEIGLKHINDLDFSEYKETEFDFKSKSEEEAKYYRNFIEKFYIKGHDRPYPLPSLDA